MKTASPKSIDEYIARFRPDLQAALHEMRRTIKDAAPDAEETIKYRIPTFVMHGNLVHFAGFRNHIGFYPTPSAIRAFRSALTGYQSSEGAVQFPLHKRVPLALIRRMVKFRVKEARAKTTAKKTGA